MNLTYEILTKDNLETIKRLQSTIFPESSFEKGYDKVIENSPEACGNVVQDYYIAYAEGEEAGIMGLYIPKGVEEHHSIWLGWYGILPTFRGKGLGKKILFDTMEIAKSYAEKFPIKYFRLYTSETVNSSAQPLYNKVMDLKEYYTNKELFNDETIAKAKKEFPDKSDDEIKEIVSKGIAIFSKSLFDDEILVPWNSRFMNLMQTIALETDNRKKD